MLKSASSAVLATVALATVALFSGEPAEEKKDGFGLGPGMVVISNIPIGKAVEPGLEFEIHNYGAVARKLAVSVRTLKDAGVVIWEKGYQDVPDPKWVKLNVNEIEVAPKSVSKIKASIELPKDDKLCNQKFIAAVCCETAATKSQGTGIALRMVSRLGIETETSSVITEAAKPSGLTLIPSIVRSSSKPGTEYSATFKIRNNNPTPVSLKPKVLSEVEPDQEKHDRYFGVGRDPINDQSWMVALEPITLAPGEVKEVSLKIKVPATAQAGKVFEELLFLENEKKELEFVRIRTAVDK